MDHFPEQNERDIPTKMLRGLYLGHLRGAYLRAGASLFMAFFVMIAYALGALYRINVIGVLGVVLFLVFYNWPALRILRRIERRQTAYFFSFFIHGLEIVGYTMIIYFLGGLQAAWLALIYAALIFYVGTVGPPKYPLLLATLSAGSLFLMWLLQLQGILPVILTVYQVNRPPRSEMSILLAVIGLLYVNGFASSYAGRLLGKNRRDIQEKNRSLEAALVRARESDRMKSQFLANMSHELRTPLNHIIGFTELVCDQNVGELNTTQCEFLNDVMNSGRHLLSLINDVLDLSQADVGRMELLTEEFDLRQLLKNSLNMFREKALKQGVKLSLSTDGLPETVWADERKIKQILYNLLSNAVKFTPSGGSVRLAARLARGPDNAGRTVVDISVTDSGIGIKDTDLGRIFNPFEQADKVSERRNGGTGLGLSLSRKLVELHGGRIWAESPGKGLGSTFSFVLPLHGTQRRRVETVAGPAFETLPEKKRIQPDISK